MVILGGERCLMIEVLLCSRTRKRIFLGSYGRPCPSSIRPPWVRNVADLRVPPVALPPVVHSNNATYPPPITCRAKYRGTSLNRLPFRSPPFRSNQPPLYRVSRQPAKGYGSRGQIPPIDWSLRSYASQRATRSLQGYFAHEKTLPPRTLQ